MNDVISAIQNAEKFRVLAAICFKFFSSRNIIQFNYSHFPPFGAHDFDQFRMIVSLGYPPEWVKAYRQAGYARRDPVIQRVVGITRPLWLSEVADYPDLTNTEMAYFHLWRSCGVLDDLLIPVFGPAGRAGGFGIGFAGEHTKPGQSEILELQWICQCAHIRYCELLESKLENGSSVSNRELQVLRYIARGKTNSQIAEELSVTTKTVDTYLSRVFQKLEVHDRMTAALRAIAMGLID